GEHRLPEVVEIAAVSRIFGQEGALDRLGSLCTVAVGRIDHSTKLRLVPGRGVEPHRRVDRQRAEGHDMTLEGCRTRIIEQIAGYGAVEGRALDLWTLREQLGEL